MLPKSREEFDDMYRKKWLILVTSSKNSWKQIYLPLSDNNSN